MSLRNVILVGDVLDRLREIPDESVHCVVTSPPYWGLLDYGVAGQIGLEATPELFVARIVEVFREVRRVLRADGTCWVNLGDSYAQTTVRNRGGVNGTQRERWVDNAFSTVGDGLKPKDLCGIPWRVAFALQADGWYLRSDIIWHKPNPMPESVTDRPTKSHEYLFLLTKSARYFYDADAVREVGSGVEWTPEQYESLKKTTPEEWYQRKDNPFSDGKKSGNKAGGKTPPGGRNRRDVWTIATEAFPGAHFATFPRKLVEPCILAGCPAKVCPKCGAGWVKESKRPEPPPDVFTSIRVPSDEFTNSGFRKGGIRRGSGQKYQNWRNSHPPVITEHPTCTCGNHGLPTGAGMVLDPFFGSGTVGVVALSLGRQYIGIELNTAYADMARNRIEHGTVDPSEVSEIESQGMLFDMSNSNIMQSPAQEAGHAAP